MEDDHGVRTTRTADTSLPNHVPQINSVSFQTYPDRNAFKISSVLQFPDDGSGEIHSCGIIIDDGETTYSVGNMNQIDTSTVECIQENVGSDQFPSITVDEELTVQVKATDIHGGTGTRTTLYNVPTGIN